MNTSHAPRLTSRRRWMTGATAAACASLALLAPAPHAHALAPVPVPPGLEVPAQNKLFRAEHAVGTQNYVCLPSATAPSGFAWTLHGPQATLSSVGGRPTATHYSSLNPEEPGTIRAAWQDSRDGSTVWANAVEISSDAAYVDPNAIPWLKLQMVGRVYGPTGSRRFARTTFIQRVNTSGGKAPATGCAAAGDIGKRELVPYETDYLFYKSTARD